MADEVVTPAKVESTGDKPAFTKVYDSIINKVNKKLAETPKEAPKETKVAEEKAPVSEETTSEETETSKEKPAEGDNGKAKNLHRLKADGQELEVPYEELVRLASMGKHGESRNAEANKKIREADVEMEYARSLVRQMNDGNVKKSQQKKVTESANVIPPAFEVDEEYDDDQTKMFKKTINVMSSKINQMESIYQSQQNELETRQLLVEFEKARHQFGIPSHAGPMVLALLRTGEEAYANSDLPYNMYAALHDYKKSMPKATEYVGTLNPDEEAILALEKNEALYTVLKKRIIEKYNVEDQKRRDDNKVPAGTGEKPSSSTKNSDDISSAKKMSSFGKAFDFITKKRYPKEYAKK